MGNTLSIFATRRNLTVTTLAVIFYYLYQARQQPSKRRRRRTQFALEDMDIHSTPRPRGATHRCASTPEPSLAPLWTSKTELNVADQFPNLTPEDVDQLHVHLKQSQVTSLKLNTLTHERDTNKKLFNALKGSNVTRLECWCTHITNQSIDFLASNVLPFTVIDHLDMKINKCNNLAAQYLSEQLERIPTLTWLSVRSDHHFDDQAAKHFAAVLPNTNIQHFRLRSNQLGDDGVRYIANAVRDAPNLIALHLFGNNITDEGLRRIAAMLDTDRGISNITELHVLQDKHAAPGFGDAGASAMGDVYHLSKLKDLALRGKKLGNQGVEHIAKVLHLARLDVLLLRGHSSHEKGIGFNGLQILSEKLKHSTIQRLDLASNSLGDKAIEQLSKTLSQCRSLTYLNLYSNKITDHGAVHLAKALEECQVRDLFLAENFIGPQGAEEIFKALCNRWRNRNRRNTPPSFPLRCLTGVFLDTISTEKCMDNMYILESLQEIVECGALSLGHPPMRSRAMWWTEEEEEARRSRALVQKYVATKFCLFDLKQRQFVLDQCVRTLPVGEMFDYLTNEFVPKSPKDAALVNEYMTKHDRRSSSQLYVNKINLEHLLHKTLEKKVTGKTYKKLYVMVETLFVTKVVFRQVRWLWLNWGDVVVWAAGNDDGMLLLDLVVQFWVYLNLFHQVRDWVLDSFENGKYNVRSYERNKANHPDVRSFWNLCLGGFELDKEPVWNSATVEGQHTVDLPPLRTGASSCWKRALHAITPQGDHRDCVSKGDTLSLKFETERKKLRKKIARVGNVVSAVSALVLLVVGVWFPACHWWYDTVMQWVREEGGETAWLNQTRVGPYRVAQWVPLLMAVVWMMPLVLGKWQRKRWRNYGRYSAVLCPLSVHVLCSVPVMPLFRVGVGVVAGYQLAFQVLTLLVDVVWPWVKQDVVGCCLDGVVWCSVGLSLLQCFDILVAVDVWGYVRLHVEGVLKISDGKE